jgi:hypothetical protein
MRYIFAIRNAEGKRQLGKLDWKGGGFQPITDVPKQWFMNTDALGQVRLSLAPDGKEPRHNRGQALRGHLDS